MYTGGGVDMRGITGYIIFYGSISPINAIVIGFT